MPPRKTQEQFEKDVFDKLGPDYELLGPYPGSHGKVPMRHKICGNIFDKNVHDIITKGSGCPYCFGNKPKLYNEEWVIQNTPAPFHYVSGYNGMREKALFHCDVCDSDFLQQPRRVIIEKIYGCNCQVNKKLTHQQYLDRLGEDCLNEFEFLTEYKNIDSPIIIRHKTCGEIFSLTPYQFETRHKKKYCPICYYKKSHGEIAIAAQLKKLHINNRREYIFKDLPNRRFDFYLPELQVAIEFDGVQHFQFIKFFHETEENFKVRKQADKEKNEYCSQHGITLYRIPWYEEDNIPTILTQLFIEKSSTTIEKFIVK